MDIFVGVCERFRVVFLDFSGVVGALRGVCSEFSLVFVFSGVSLWFFLVCLVSLGIFLCLSRDFSWVLTFN